MRIAPVTLWLMVIALITAGLWTLPGCRQASEDQAAVGEAAPDTAELPEDHAHEQDDVVAEPPADPGEAVPESLSPEQAQAALDAEVDLNRAYSQGDFGPLGTVLRMGGAEQKVRARQTLETLLLNSRVAETRAAAAGVLATDPAGSVDALTRAALHDPEKAVRRQAIESLGGVPASPELLASLQLAQGAEDPEVRLAALVTEMDVRLNSYQPGDDTAWMARLLGRRRDDASAQLQMRLDQIGDPVLPAVIEVLETASDPHVRAAAACTITIICAGTNPKQQEFAELSRAMVTKEGLEQPRPANLDGLRPLENALANDSSWEVRAVAAQGLGYLGQASSAPLLGDALHDTHEEVRWWAALALETVPSIDALNDLAHASRRDSSTRVRTAAVRSLGWVGDDRAVMPLILATSDNSASVRQAAAQELARFGSSTSLQALVALFNDPDEDVRWAAVVAAGELRDEETVPALIASMRDPSPMVANAAERALQRMGRAEQRFGFASED